MIRSDATSQDQIPTWPASSALSDRGCWRQRIVNEALRPSSETADWLGVIARIHWQAVRLWLKRVPFFRKPAPPDTFVTR